MKQMKSDLKAYGPVDTFFAVNSVDLRKKGERPYIALSLADRTGQINGYVWNDPEDVADLLRGTTFVHLQGVAKKHNDTLILNVEYISPANEEEIDFSDFIDVVPGGVDLWMKKLFVLANAIRDTNCRALIKSFLDDPKFYEDLKMWPAGKTVHHNYVGGFVEHTVKTMSLAVHMSEEYPGLLDRDLLLTASFLHDIGKLREMTGGPATRYITEGKLLGHISMGVLMLEDKLRLMKGFPAELGLLLKHMILAHHGTQEFGSPVKPATPEALALHLIDNFDAKMNHLYCFLKDSPPDNQWSSYDKFLGTEICQVRFKKKPCLDSELREDNNGDR